MSVVTRCGAVSLVLAGLVGATPAFAESAPGQGSGSWTDPPVRGSSGLEAPAPVRPAEVKPPAAAATAAPPAATPAEQAAARLGVKPVETRRHAGVTADRTRSPVARPRMVERPLVITRRPGRIVERPIRALAQRSSRRVVRSYAYDRGPYASARADAYDGGNSVAISSRRRLAGWGGLLDDSSAGRAAQARDAGYTVMRMRTYAYPDGTRVQRLVPYDSRGFGDLD